MNELRQSPRPESDDRKGIQSIEVGSKILDALAASRRPLALKEVSVATGMTSSSTHRYLLSFVRTGLVTQCSETGFYELGPAALRYGLAAMSRFDLLNETHSAVQEVCNELECTALISVWSEQGPIIVRWIRSSVAVVTSLDIGSVLPLLTSATGRIFFAYMPRAATKRLVSEEKKRLAKQNRTIGIDTSAAGLNQICQSIRTNGLERVDSSLIPGLAGISAPVFNAQGDLALSVTFIGAHTGIIEPTGRYEAALKALTASLSLAQPSGSVHS